MMDDIWAKRWTNRVLGIDTQSTSAWNLLFIFFINNNNFWQNYPFCVREL